MAPNQAQYNFMKNMKILPVSLELHFPSAAMLQYLLLVPYSSSRSLSLLSFFFFGQISSILFTDGRFTPQGKLRHQYP